MALQLNQIFDLWYPCDAQPRARSPPEELGGGSPHGRFLVLLRQALVAVAQARSHVGGVAAKKFIIRALG